MQETAVSLLDALLDKADVARTDVKSIVGTGYGRISFNLNDVPTTIETEIFCHALGAYRLDPTTEYIIDIGGQDCKAVEVGPVGDVVEFAMNDKCSAGTGRYLERAADMLEIDVMELGPLSLRHTQDLSISSQCVVFAESEIVGLLARGEQPADVAYGVHKAIARRIRALANQIKMHGNRIMFTGGVSRNEGMCAVLEDVFGCTFINPPIDATYAGAIGAVALARHRVSGKVAVPGRPRRKHGIAVETDRLVDLRQDSIISGAETRKKVGFLCTYTPPELFRAFDAIAIRLFKTATPSQVASGERLTRSVYCDFIKGTLGAFRDGDPLYSGLDSIMSVYTCDCTKRVGEALLSYGVSSSTYILPRYSDNPDSVDFFEQELTSLAHSLERLTGNRYDENRLRESITLYNSARRSLRAISALRKNPLIDLLSTEFTRLVRAYWYIDPDQSLRLYERFLSEISSRPLLDRCRLRIMVAGGINADDDNRILQILESELGVQVAVEDTCSGLRAICLDVDEDDPSPLHALAQGYLNKHPCARMKPFNRSVEESLRMADDYGVDAVVYTYVKFCSSYGQGRQSFIEAFQTAGYPTMDIGMDFSLNDYGQVKTRLETFVGMVREQKVHNGAEQ